MKPDLSNRPKAVIAGATGVIGHGLAEALARSEAWDVVALSRRPIEIPGVHSIAVDLTNPADSAAKLDGLGGVTHLFYAGRFNHAAGVSEPVAENLTMLRSVLDPVEAGSPGLRHVHLVHGTKHYGSNLGPYRTPAKEADPRSLQPNFYYAQEDHIAARQRGRAWSWSISRPHGILHDVPDTPRNLVLVIAAYAVLCRELGLPLSFPGTAENFRSIYQCTSSDQVVAALRWMADEPACANQAYNVTNGDFIRWCNLWPTFADYFGMEPGPVRTVRLADVMADKAPVWDRIVARYGLVPTPYERLALWSYGDFVLQPGWDIMSDTTKIRRAGFHRAVDTEQEFLRLFDEFKARRILPP